MLIYCDTNVYHRPFNDQSQSRIQREASAFASIVEWVEKGKLDLLKSEILEFEIAQNVDAELKAKVQSYLKLCRSDFRASDNQLKLAQQLEKECDFKGRDALHISAACLGNATYCISCDDQMVKRARCCAKITRENGFEVTLVGPEEIVRILEMEMK